MHREAGGCGDASCDYMPAVAQRAGQFLRGFREFSVHLPLTDIHRPEQVRTHFGRFIPVNRPRGVRRLESPSGPGCCDKLRKLPSHEFPASCRTRMAYPPRTLIVFATYNEIENLPRLLAEVSRAAPTADLLVVDDNSPDGTSDWCERERAVDPRLHLLRRAGKQGYGSAIVAGMQYAIDHAYDYVITMDADFSHQPCYLPNLIGGMETAPAVDVMIGSRYVKDGGTKDWPLKRRLMSGAVNRVARLFLRLDVRDCSSGYRCFRVSRLAMVDLAGLLSNGYSFPEEILWRLRRVGATFRETPITFPDRTQGETKMNVREAISAMRVLMSLGLRNLLKMK